MSVRKKRDILTENLLSCEQLSQDACEERDLHLHEYWQETLYDTENKLRSLSREDILSWYDESVSCFSSQDDPAQDVNHKISFVQNLSSRFTLEKLLTNLISNPIQKPTDVLSPTIAFWPDNSDSGKAYEKFRHLFQTSKALYVKRFSEVCDVLISGEADFGIIPIENSGYGKHFGFYRMMEQSDLMFCAVCNMEHAESDTQTKYALIARSAVFFETTAPVRMELTFYTPDHTALAEFWHITEKLHIAVTRMDALPLCHQNEGLKVYSVISMEITVLSVFLCYLWLFKVAYSVLELFIQIDKD